ncbi:Uncharacterized protein Rs2_23367 [Raphanus sativus]|nr:Uncharacterized protein Rs2_23367 [Raphanus sativus]
MLVLSLDQLNWSHLSSFACVNRTTRQCLHIGQVKCCSSHLSTQRTWNPWLHLGSSLRFSPETKSDKQMMHSSPIPDMFILCPRSKAHPKWSDPTRVKLVIHVFDFNSTQEHVSRTLPLDRQHDGADAGNTIGLSCRRNNPNPTPETCPPDPAGDRNHTHLLHLNSLTGERRRHQYRDLFQSQGSRHLLPLRLLHRRKPSIHQGLRLKQSRKHHQVTVGNRNPTRAAVDTVEAVRRRNREPTAHPHRKGATPETEPTVHHRKMRRRKTRK